MEKGLASLASRSLPASGPSSRRRSLIIACRRRDRAAAVAYFALDRIGYFSAYRRVAWSRVDRLVFVCLGNICRSPYAAARAHRLGLSSASFGLRARTGAGAHPLALGRARQRDIDLDRHTSTHRSDFSLRAGDLLIGFEPAHGAQLRGDALPDGVQISLLGLWCTPSVPYIPDPYGQAPGCFDRCYEVIDEALDVIALRLSAR